MTNTENSTTSEGPTLVLNLTILNYSWSSFWGTRWKLHSHTWNKL